MLNKLMFLSGLKSHAGDASGGVSVAGLFKEHVLEQSADVDFRSLETIWSIWGATLGSIGF